MLLTSFFLVYSFKTIRTFSKDTYHLVLQRPHIKSVTRCIDKSKLNSKQKCSVKNKDLLHKKLTSKFVSKIIYNISLPKHLADFSPAFENCISSTPLSFRPIYANYAHKVPWQKMEISNETEVHVYVPAYHVRGAQIFNPCLLTTLCITFYVFISILFGIAFKSFTFKDEM